MAKTPGTPIAPAETATLPRLEACEASLRDLTGLEAATNLTRLELYGNSITDTSALASLTNLTHLVLYINAMSDQSPMAGLTKLRYLNLEDELNIRCLGFGEPNKSDTS